MLQLFNSECYNLDYNAYRFTMNLLYHNNGGCKLAKKYYTYLLIAALIFVLVACTSDSNVEVSDEEGNTEEPAPGGDLVASYATDVSSLDPAGQNDLPSDQRRNVIYEGLLYLNDDLEPEPRLAETYEQTDETTWEFHLREGVKFHDGTEFTAEAVKANIERIVDPAVASSRANIFEMIEEV